MDRRENHETNGKIRMNGDCMEGSSSQPDRDVAADGGGGGEDRDSSTPPTSSQPDPGEGASSSSSASSSVGGSREGSSAPSKASTPALPQYHYTREELLELKDSPLALEWPDALDPAHNKGPGRWDPERWMRSIHDDRRPGSGGQQAVTASNNRIDRPPDLELKRSRDPRERVKQEEQDGLVLSPQRRSFSTGCHGLQQPGSTNRPDSPAERAPQTHREIPTRRIGSGRISRRMEDLEPPTAGDRRELSGRRDRDLDRNLDRNLERNLDRNVDRNIDRGNIERNLDRGLDQHRDARDWRNKNDARFDRDDRYDNRRRFFEDEEEKRNKRHVDDRRISDRRRMGGREEEAPEWFTEGPTSQNEFIELVGFDDIPEEGSGNNKPNKRERRRSKRDKDGGSRKSSRSNTPVLMDGEKNKQDMDVNQMKEQHQMQQLQLQRQQDDKHHHQQPPQQQPTVIEPVNDQDCGFNIDDFLGDIIGFPGHAEEIVAPSHVSNSSSKLRQFFQRGESPTFPSNFVASLQNSRRSSVDLPPHLNNMLTGLDSSRFFAPISPADKTGVNSIVDLLQQAGSNIGGSDNMRPPPMGPPQIPRSQAPSIKSLMMDGKGQSLEEVEAGLQRNMRRGMGQHNHQQPPPPPQIQHPQNSHQNKTMSAFNDFVNDICLGGGVVGWEDGMGWERKETCSKMVMNTCSTELCTKWGPFVILPIQIAARASDFGILLMKGNNAPPAAQQQAQVSHRPMAPPAIPNLNVPPPNLITPHSQPPPPMHNMPQMSNQGGPPPQHREDIVLKLLQAQQQMQQQHTQQQQQQKRQQLLQQALQQSQQQQPPQQQHLDPIQQLMGGIGRMSVSPSPQTQDRDTFVRDAIQRPDVQNLLQQVASGQVTAGQLYTQLGSGNLNKNQSDAVTTVLRFLKRGRDNITPMVRDTRPMALSPTPQAVVAGGLTLGGGPSISPRVVSPNPDASNMLNPHMLQHQSRISPLMFAGGSGLSVGNGPRRTPSHQELVAHTQSIMQKALLKQELEKAKEKHRKREAERAKSPNPSMPGPIQGPGNSKGPQEGSPNKTGVKSQSPLAFTPTSVMRKMTADKDRHDRSDKPDRHNITPLRKIMGRRGMVSSHENVEEKLGQAQKCSEKKQKKHFLLGLSRGGKNEKRDMRSGSSPLPGLMMMGNRPAAPGIINFNNPNQRPPQPSMQQNMGNIRTQQQNLNNLRALHVAQQQAMLTQQLMRNGGLNGSNPPAPGAAPGNLGGGPHHRMPNANPPGPLHQLLLNNNSQASMHHHNKPDGGLQIPLLGLGSGSHRSSPVNNLAQFFGRDILAQAGGLPELPGGKVLSLEEVERLQQQAVPN
ncbi:unnamed protein product, partial [Meganyctiphanes norvegica]